MSHLERERTCTVCNETFRLSEHGVAGATAIAQTLDSGALEEADAPAVASTCPACLGTEQLDESAANAELFRLEHAVKQARERQIPRDTKVFASGLSLIGTMIALGAQFWAAFRGHSPATWGATTLGGVAALAGVVIGVVVVARVYSRRKTQL